MSLYIWRVLYFTFCSSFRDNRRTQAYVKQLWSPLSHRDGSEAPLKSPPMWLWAAACSFMLQQRQWWRFCMEILSGQSTPNLAELLECFFSCRFCKKSVDCAADPQESISLRILISPFKFLGKIHNKFANPNRRSVPCEFSADFCALRVDEICYTLCFYSNELQIFHPENLDSICPVCWHFRRVKKMRHIDGWVF